MQLTRRTIPSTTGNIIPADLRIVHVVSSLQVGGMEQFVLRIAAEQRRRGARSAILAIRGGPLQEETKRLGIETVVLHGSSVAHRLAETAYAYLRLRPQIVHAHNETSLHYAVASKLVGRPRVVLTFHGQGKGCHRRPGVWERSMTNAVVAVSQASAGRLSGRKVLDRLHVIRNGVEPLRSSRTREEMRRELGFGSEPIGIIVARIDGMKGHSTLLRSLLEPSDPEIMVLVVGDGPGRADLERERGMLGVSPNRFRLLGFRSDIPDLLSAADWFVLPSLAEGLPLSLLEAMSLGLPVVATPVGGIPEVITDGREGFLVPINSPLELAAAQHRLASSSRLRGRMGQAGQELVAERFTMEKMVDSYAQLYRELRSPTRPGPRALVR